MPWNLGLGSAKTSNPECGLERERESVLTTSWKCEMILIRMKLMYYR